MSSKKFLSTKKTAQQTISISPALKDWITRYVHVNYQKNQEDSRFKSVSAFICEIMEGIMVLFQNGKTINDLDKVQDKIRHYNTPQKHSKDTIQREGAGSFLPLID